MELLRAMGLPIAKTEMAQFEDQRVLIVERFDRSLHPDGWIVRIPHEDLLQAQGLPSHLKYESDGGPGVSDMMNLLRGSANARDDRQTFFKALLLASCGYRRSRQEFQLGDCSGEYIQARSALRYIVRLALGRKRRQSGASAKRQNGHGFAH